jgi:hypothetical protein
MKDGSPGLFVPCQADLLPAMQQMHLFKSTDLPSHFLVCGSHQHYAATTELPGVLALCRAAYLTNSAPPSWNLCCICSTPAVSNDSFRGLVSKHYYRRAQTLHLAPNMRR